MLGLSGTKNKEPEIALAKLEDLLAAGPDRLVEFLKEATGRSISALKRDLDTISLSDEHQLLIVCDHDSRLASRVRPFAKLIRRILLPGPPWWHLPAAFMSLKVPRAAVQARTTRRPP